MEFQLEDGISDEDALRLIELSSPDGSSDEESSSSSGSSDDERAGPALSALGGSAAGRSKVCRDGNGLGMRDGYMTAYLSRALLGYFS